MKLILRKAVLDDYPSVCKIYQEIDQRHSQALPQIFHPVQNGPARSIDTFCELISNPNILFLLAEQHTEVVGLVQVSLYNIPGMAMLVSRRYGYIEAIIVRQDHHGEGVGRALIERAEHWALENGVYEMELTVYNFNQNAIRFYEKAGYQVLSQRMWKHLK